MAKREWIGEYVLYVDYKNPYREDDIITRGLSLGKCLCVNEAKDKAVAALLREFPTTKMQEVYICDGWGHLFYM